MEEKSWGIIIKELLQDMYTKWFIRIFIFGLLIAFIWGWIDYRSDIASSKHAKFLWWERNIPKGYPDTAYTTVIKHDTVIVYSDYMDKVSKNHIQPGHKKAGVQVYKQNIDSGSSGIQNNAPNNGQQAGRDINNNFTGIKSRHPDNDLINSVIRAYREAHLDSMQIWYTGGDEEGFNYSKEIANALTKRGINKIDISPGFNTSMGEVSFAQTKSFFVVIVPSASNLNK